MADLDNTLLGALLLGVIPALVVTLYFWLQYPKGREPTSKVMGLVFLGGMLCTLPVIPVEMLVSALTARDGVAHVAEEAFFTAGLVEELAKYYVIRRFAMRHPAFTCVQDGLFYGVLAGSGFSLVEDLMFMAGLGTDVGVLRAVLPFHSIWTGIMGYYLGLARFAREPQQARRWTLQGVAIAIFLHGSWDLGGLASQAQVWPPLLTGTVGISVGLASFYLLQRRLVVARRVDAARRQRGTARLIG